MPFDAVVVVPAYDASATARRVLDAVAAAGLPVVVVNVVTSGVAGDVDVLAGWAGADPAGRRVVQSDAGKADALWAAFAVARADGRTHAVTIDADGQFDPADVPTLVDHARRRPDALVLGTRPPGCPRWTGLSRWAANGLVWIESGATVADSQCGLRAYPLTLASVVRCHARGRGLHAEAVVRAAWAGTPIVEVPVTCRADWPGLVPPARSWGQAARLHAGLLIAAGRPRWRRPHRVAHRAAAAGFAPPPGHSISRRLGRWFNPMTAWRQARHDHAGRTRFAAGLAAGVYIGCLPTYGLQTILGLFVARRFHLHPASVVAGTNVSMPPVGPFVIAGGIAVGHVLLHGSLPTLSAYKVDAHDLGRMLGPILAEWVVGAVVVGAVLAGLTFVGVDILLRALTPDAGGK